MKNFEKICLSFFLLVFLVPVVIGGVSSTTTTTTTGPLSEYNGSFYVNPMTGNIVLPGNVTYPDGTACTAADQCAGGNCVHSICRSGATYCGDGYCDSGETCSCAHDCGSCGGVTIMNGGTGGSYYGSTTTTTPVLVPSSETRTIAGISNGTSGTFNFTNSNTLKIMTVTVLVNETVSNSHVTVSETSLPAGANAAIGSEGNVYKYLEITTNIPNSKITLVTFDFKIEKSWITANGIDASTISLKRYVDGIWVSLPTVQVSEDSTYIYFESTSPGFSLFGMTGQRTSVTTTSVSTTSSSSTTTTAAVPAFGPSMWLTVFLLVIIAGVVIFGLKKKTIMKEIMPR